MTLFSDAHMTVTADLFRAIADDPPREAEARGGLDGIALGYYGDVPVLLKAAALGAEAAKGLTLYPNDNQDLFERRIRRIIYLTEMPDKRPLTPTRARYSINLVFLASWTGAVIRSCTSGRKRPLPAKEGVVPSRSQEKEFERETRENKAEQSRAIPRKTLAALFAPSDEIPSVREPLRLRRGRAATRVRL